MANGRFVIELADRSWGSLDDDEKDVFADWLKSAGPQDLYMLIRHAKRSRKQSSVKAMKAVLDEDS